MEIESCAMFLVGTILTCCGVSVISITVLFLNHLFSKYWKTVTLYKLYDIPTIIDGESPQSNTLTVSANSAVGSSTTSEVRQ